MARSGKLPASQTRILLCLCICIIGGAATLAFRESALDLALGRTSQPSAHVLALTILFLWFFGSQLVLAPSGTISIVLAGLVFGAGAGVLYFLAMIAACAVVHPLSRLDQRDGDRIAWRLVRRRRARRVVLCALARIRSAPIAATAAIRLVPVIPSAGCTILVAAAGAPLQKALLGTLATGWVRPVAFAVFSQEVWLALRGAGSTPILLLSSPLFWITLVCILAPTMIVGVFELHHRRSAARAGRSRLTPP